MPATLIVLLVGQLFAIFPAQALASSELTSSVFSRWIPNNGSVPYDGGVNPLNGSTNSSEDKSEALEFGCHTPPVQVQLLFQTYAEAFSEKVKSEHLSPSQFLERVKSQNLRPTITKYIITNTDDQHTLTNEVVHDPVDGIGGCFSDQPIEENLSLSITEIIHPITFFTKLIGSIISTPLIFIVNLMEPVVFRSLFTTPHTERGDTIFSQYTGTVVKAGGTQATCEGGSECGFSTRSLKQSQYTESFWVSLTLSLRSILSATYGLIVVAIGIIYMYRPNVRAAYDIKRLIPRIVASVCLMLLFPYLLGLIITVSNYFVQAVFGVGGGNSLVGLNDTINSIIAFQSDLAIKGGVAGAGAASVTTSEATNPALQTLMNLVLLGMFTWYMVVLFCLTVIKQIALIFAVILAPFACLAYVTDKWAHITRWWFRCIVGICVIPIFQAIILRVGYGAANEVYGSGGLTEKAFAAIILVITFMLMAKALRMIFGWVGTSPFGVGPQEVHAGARKGVGRAVETAGAVGVLASGGAAGMMGGSMVRGAGAGMGSNPYGSKGSSPYGTSARSGAVTGAKNMYRRRGGLAFGEGGLTRKIADKARAARGLEPLSEGEVLADIGAEKGRAKMRVAPELHHSDQFQHEGATGIVSGDPARKTMGDRIKGETATPEDSLRSIDTKMGELTDAVRAQTQTQAQGQGGASVQGGTTPPGYTSHGSLLVPHGSVPGPQETQQGAQQEVEGVAPSGPARATRAPGPARQSGVSVAGPSPAEDEGLGERKLERQRSAKTAVTPPSSEPVIGPKGADSPRNSESLDGPSVTPERPRAKDE